MASCCAGSSCFGCFESDWECPLSEFDGEVHVDGLGACVYCVADSAVSSCFFGIIDVEVVEVEVAVAESGCGG